MVNPVLCDNVSVPLSYDIQVNVTRTANILSNTLDQIVFATPESPLSGSLSPGVGRVRFYSTLNDVIDAYGTDGAAYEAAKDFFAQSPRPAQLAIGQIFTTPQPGAMRSGVVAALADFQAVNDGAFTISIDGDPQEISGMNFTSDVSYDDIALTIETALQAIGTGGYTAATVEASATTGTNVTFLITSGTSGDGSTVSELTAPTAGTDISGTNTTTSVYLNATSATATLFLGYTPTGIANELTLIYEAAQCQGKLPYGFVIDNVYIDTQDQLDAAAWAAGQNVVLFIDTHNPLTIDPDNTTNNAQQILNTDNKRVSGFWSDTQEDLDAQIEYKSISALAWQLSFDPNAADSDLDLSYKNGPGLTTTSVSTNDLNILGNRRTNVLTTQGAGNHVFKYNYTYSNDWKIEQVVGVDNLVNDLQVAIFTVFIQSKKVPYTLAGQAKISQAIKGVGAKYERNGVAADRVIEDSTAENGQRTIPAFSVEFPPLSSVTSADRAANILRGVVVTVQLSESIHSIVINLEVQG